MFFIQRAWFSLMTRGLSVDIVFGLEVNYNYVYLGFILIPVFSMLLC